MASHILRRHPEYAVVLMGGKEDQARAKAFTAELANRIPDSQRHVISLVGETDFDLWASVVGRCQWVFSGDTAAIHLASVLGTRVFNVSVGPVRWAETGPYGNGHYVIAPQTGTGGANVAPEAAYAAWSYAASEWATNDVRRLKHISQI